MLRQCFVGIGYPVDRARGVEWAIESTAVGVFDDTTCFFEYQCAADVVRVGAEVFFDVEHAKCDGSDVGDKAIMPAEEFVELSAGGDVLIVEYLRRAVAGVAVKCLP